MPQVVSRRSLCRSTNVTLSPLESSRLTMQPVKPHQRLSKSLGRPNNICMYVCM